MGVSGPCASVDSILGRRPDERPFAIPVEPGAQGIWLIRVTPTPIGYVVKRAERGSFGLIKNSTPEPASWPPTGAAT